MKISNLPLATNPTSTDVLPLDRNGITYKMQYQALQGPQGPQGATGPKGDTGKGISSYTEYYAVNNSTTPPADSAFGTTYVSPTATNRYLWSYTVIQFSDNTDLTSDKRLLCVYGQTGNTGEQGPQGIQGETGPQGATGPGVAAGGTAGQVLYKKSATAYDTEWRNPEVTSGQFGDLKGTVFNISDLFIYEQPSLSVASGLLPFPVKTNDSITIERIDGQLFQGAVQIRFYDKNRTMTDYYSTTPYDKAVRTVTYAHTDAAYVGVTDVGSVAGVYKITNNSSKSLLATEIKERKAADVATTNRIDILASEAAKAKVINRFNKQTIEPGKYVNPNNGTIASSESFFASDFIYIGDLASVTVSYTHIFGWYDEDKEWIGHPNDMNSGDADLTFTPPSNAVYLRFSAYNTNLDLAQIGGSVTRSNYIPYGIYKLPELRISESQIDTSDDSRVIVDASGAGDYTSFTQAIYETVDDGTDVYVKPGTYNIVSEYVALFGQSAVDSMADADSATFNGFQYGVRLRKRKVEFAPGAHLVCDWTGHTVDGTHRFSALGVDYNVEIIGLDLDVTGTFYCIHDDYGIATPYTVKYINCRVVGHNITNANCIGGGCKKYSRHILENCYFDNNLTGSATVRYHNTNAEGAEPEIYVSNCYFNNWFTPRWYGTQTTKMRVYVNNCEARSIHKMAESSSYNVDNVELYKWCNTETAPVT